MEKVSPKICKKYLTVPWERTSYRTVTDVTWRFSVIKKKLQTHVLFLNEAQFTLSKTIILVLYAAYFLGLTDNCIASTYTGQNEAKNTQYPHPKTVLCKWSKIVHALDHMAWAIKRGKNYIKQLNLQHQWGDLYHAFQAATIQEDQLMADTTSIAHPTSRVSECLHGSYSAVLSFPESSVPCLH